MDEAFAADDEDEATDEAVTCVLQKAGMDLSGALSTVCQARAAASVDGPLQASGRRPQGAPAEAQGHLIYVLFLLCFNEINLPQSFLLRRPLRRLFSLPSALSLIRLPHSLRACDVSIVPFPPMVWFV